MIKQMKRFQILKRESNMQYLRNNKISLLSIRQAHDHTMTVIHTLRMCNKWHNFLQSRLPLYIHQHTLFYSRQTEVALMCLWAMDGSISCCATHSIGVCPGSSMQIASLLQEEMQSWTWASEKKHISKPKIPGGTAQTETITIYIA